MSDVYGTDRPARMDLPPRTQPLPPAEGFDDAARREREPVGDDLLRDPIAAMRQPDNRSKLWLTIAALTLLNTLLLLGLLVAHAGEESPEPVVVDGTPCLVVEGEEAGTLFCKR
jgi:hypothetical protein